MVNLKLESWSAMAPALETVDSWQRWFEDGLEADIPEAKPKLKQIPPLLRRRFSTLGKYTAQSVLNLGDGIRSLPIIYASRHGDTALTLPLLENIGLDEPMSPTDFSLAVHNAIGGLLSIAQKETSPMTAIASVENLVLSCLHEAIAQLECFKKVLCVIYDAPLPDLYKTYEASLPFPIALAFVLGKAETDIADISLALKPKTDDYEFSSSADLIQMIEILIGKKKRMLFPVGENVWQLEWVAQ